MGARGPKKQFAHDRFDFVGEILLPLSAFTEYVQLTEHIIEKEVQQKIKENREYLNNIQHEHELLFIDIVDHEIKLNIYQLYYNSQFFAIYSFLERKMYQMCKSAELDHKLKVSDLSGNGIFQYCAYIKKVLDINLDKVNAEWAEIVKYNKIRNRLIHSPTNEIEKSEEKLISLFKSIRGITIYEKENTVEFQITDKEFLLTFNRVIDRFFDDIYYAQPRR